jgi:hypothetical protein
MAKFFDQFSSFTEGEKAWDEKAKKAQKARPLKVLKNTPNIPGITKKTKRFLKIKSLYYLIKEDKGRVLPHLKKKPFRYFFSLIRSYFKKRPYKVQGDFYLYGIDSIQEMEEKLLEKNSVFLLGFSYCHKPFECPSGRFSDKCIHDPNNPVCSQCFIGKAIHAAPAENTKIAIIPTVHYIGQKVLELVDQYPKKNIVFLITACEMTLKMFADFGNMTKIKGTGIRLDGRICNTLRAFDLSEKGIKPGLTVVLDETQKEMLRLLRLRATL